MWQNDTFLSPIYWTLCILFDVLSWKAPEAPQKGQNFNFILEQSLLKNFLEGVLTQKPNFLVILKHFHQMWLRIIASCHWYNNSNGLQKGFKKAEFPKD